MPPPAQHPLLTAASLGDVAGLQKHAGAKPVAVVEADGRNALHLAASEGHQAAVEWLLAHGFNLEATTKKGLSAFHFAVFKGHRLLAEWLLSRGSNVHVADATGAPGRLAPRGLRACVCAPLVQRYARPGVLGRRDVPPAPPTPASPPLQAAPRCTWRRCKATRPSSTGSRHRAAWTSRP